MDVATDPPTTTDPHVALARTTGIIGIALLVLLFGPVIALASAGEPPLEATAAEAVAYFGNLQATWAQLTMTVLTLGMMASLWFFVALGCLLRRAEGEPPWRSAIATLSGVLLAAYGLIGAAWAAASLHGEQITSDVADFAFAFGNVGVTNVWIALASFSLSAGWVVVTTRAFERWLGWWLVVAGVGLLLARFVWTTELWVLPYLLFWSWVLVVSIRLVRRPGRWLRATR